MPKFVTHTPTINQTLLFYFMCLFRKGSLVSVLFFGFGQIYFHTSPCRFKLGSTFRILTQAPHWNKSHLPWQQNYHLVTHSFFVLYFLPSSFMRSRLIRFSKKNHFLYAATNPETLSKILENFQLQLPLISFHRSLFPHTKFGKLLSIVHGFLRLRRLTSQVLATSSFHIIFLQSFLDLFRRSKRLIKIIISSYGRQFRR